MRARMSCTVAVLLLALGVLAHAADEYEQQATVAHKHQRMVNPPSSDDECPHHSGKVYYHEGGDHDKAYEAAYDADDEAALEYSGGHHHHDHVNPGSGCGRVRGVLDPNAASYSVLRGTVDPTIAALPATITNATTTYMELNTFLQVTPRNESDNCAGAWRRFATSRNLRWTAGSLKVETADGTTPSNYTIKGSFGQPPNADAPMYFDANLYGPNKKALDVCFTPPEIINCYLSFNGVGYAGTIDRAASSDLDGPTTISDWLYTGFFLQAWPGAKHATFTCVNLV